jgi:hypothetical protein
LAPIFDLAEDWAGSGNAVYILFTHEDIAVWQNRLRAIISNEDNFLITDIGDIDRVGGWMPAKFWELLGKSRTRTVGQTLLPPPAPGSLY